jgi:uncharacterized protein (TIGR01777 family)
MEHVLIVGGSGFIGQALVRSFVARNCRVTVFDIHDGRFEHELVRYYPVDVQGGKLPTLPECHCIINLAGAPISNRFTTEYKKVIWTSRVITTRSLRQWVETQSWQPHTYVGASAVGYYGDRGSEQITEHTRPGNDTLARVCVDWEREHHAFEKLGIPVTILRQGTILGAGGYIAQLLPWFRHGFSVTLGSGANYVPWIALHDLVNIYSAICCQAIPPGIHNAVSLEYTKQSDIVATLGLLTHARFPVSAPVWALRLRFGELADVMTMSQKISYSSELKPYITTSLLEALEIALLRTA